MFYKLILSLGLFTIALGSFLIFSQMKPKKSVPPNKIPIVMYKNATCQCCTKWAEYMDTAEFEVEQLVPENLYDVKVEAGITQELSSCHTAKVGNYVVEGHVPMEDVRRLLKEKPDAIGITVPGMPIGSPGMEVEGQQADSYDVLLIHNDGSTSIWASH